MLRLSEFPKQRRHTYYFLKDARQTAQVLLTAGIDMSAVIAVREELRQQGQVMSYLAFLIQTISRVVAHYPQANATLCDGFRPRVAHFTQVNAKYALDKETGGERIVVSAVVENSDQLSVQAIQSHIDHYKAADYEGSDAFHNLRRLNGLSQHIGQWLYGKLMRNPNKRLQLQGSFTITSLGHREVELFYPISSNTLSFGVGAMTDKPVVKAGEVVVRPVLPLSLVFDHRVIDGAMAADILQAIKQGIETYEQPAHSV